MKNKKLAAMGAAAITLMSSLGLSSISVIGSAFAEEHSTFEATVDGLTYCIEDGVASVINGRECEGDWSVPNEIEVDGEKFAVTKIAEQAFADNDLLTFVKLPDSITEIGLQAFACCDILESVIIPNSVTEIKEEAFLECWNLESFFCDSVKTIGERAFYNCTSLKDFCFYDVENIGDGAFDSCGLEIVMLPETLITIGGGAFAHCGDLIKCSIPGSLKTVSEAAFAECENLEVVGIFEGVEAIGELAFACDDKLTYLILPESIKECGSLYGFDSGIESVYISNPDFEYSDSLLFDKDISIYGLKNDTVEDFLNNTDEAKFCEMYDGAYSEFSHLSVKGDTNCDYVVNLADAVLIMQAVSNPSKYGVNGSDIGCITEQGIENADVIGNGDGMTNLDALEIQKFCLGIIEGLYK